MSDSKDDEHWTGRVLSWGTAGPAFATASGSERTFRDAMTIYWRKRRSECRIAPAAAIRIVVLFTFLVVSAGLATAQSAADDVRREALAPNSETTHPLPLLGTWSASDGYRYLLPDGGFTPAWQLQQLKDGRHLLPTFITPYPVSYASHPEHVAYWQSGLQGIAALGVPLTFYAPQWEFYLSRDPYLSLPYAQNPNVWTNGKAQSKVSPFGPLAPWYELGRQWGSGAMMTQLQTWYPSPPLILFLSNNEHAKLLWTEAETDQHYLDQYGSGRSPEFKRQVVADGWVARYRELQRGFRDGLTSATWKANAIFIGYEAFGREFTGRFWGWNAYALPITNRIDPNPLMWYGGSPSYYLARYYGTKSDFTLYSPQIESMNWIFMLKEARQRNPAFWFEISTWSGGFDLKNTNQAWLQAFTPERYGAMVQFGMWLARPRLIREFPYSGQDTSELLSVNLPWLSRILAAVDRVYANGVLRRFWRQSSLVQNPSRPHPYQLEIPPEYATAPRMFLLTTNLDPPQPWTDTAGTPKLALELPVFALARVIGSAPTREWLLYAHSPLKDRSGVQITIPNYRAITVDVPIAGAFYHVNEADGSVTRVTDAPPAPTPVAGLNPPTNIRIVATP